MYFFLLKGSWYNFGSTDVLHTLVMWIDLKEINILRNEGLYDYYLILITLCLFDSILLRTFFELELILL
jgi:hypothetical protein